MKKDGRCPKKGGGLGSCTHFYMKLNKKAVKRGFMWKLTERDDLNEKHEE
jgi:hypothetical protein